MRTIVTNFFDFLACLHQTKVSIHLAVTEDGLLHFKLIQLLTSVHLDGEGGATRMRKVVLLIQAALPMTKEKLTRSEAAVKGHLLEAYA